MPYFESWEASARARKGFFKKEVNLMLLSKESHDEITRSGKHLGHCITKTFDKCDRASKNGPSGHNYKIIIILISIWNIGVL